MAPFWKGSGGLIYGNDYKVNIELVCGGSSYVVLQRGLALWATHASAVFVVESNVITGLAKRL